MIEHLARRVRRLEESAKQAGGGGCASCAPGLIQMVTILPDGSEEVKPPCLQPGPKCPRLTEERIVIKRLGPGASLDALL
jgi:hypothetical protein